MFYAAHPSRRSNSLPIVFIHGAGGNHLSWPGPLRRFDPAASTYFPDLPGHGRSDLTGQLTIAGYAENVHALCRALELTQPVLVGHSMGGAIALSLALHHPGLLCKLVLINSAARFNMPPSILAELHTDPALAVEHINHLAFSHQAPLPLIEASRQMMLSLPPDVLRADYQACASFDLVARLHEIRVPTLIIGAEGDLLTPPDDARPLADRLPNARLIILPRASHMAPLMETQAVRDAILAYLEPDLPH
jgi:pimeloyl-ACP methyl ester carboxylesterase